MPAGMTSGERMVFAAEFVRARADGIDWSTAAVMACHAVEALRDARDGVVIPDAAAMLQDMLSTGGDR